MGRNNMVVLFRRVALLTAHRCTPSAGWSGFDTLEPARWVGGTGAMIRGLEDGLDSISALRFAACNTRRHDSGAGSCKQEPRARSETTSRQKRAKRAGVGIDADCLGTRPDRGRMAASPGMLCYPRIRPWERSLRGGGLANTSLPTYSPYCLLRDLS